MKGYICDICEKFVDNPFKVHMREFVMTIDFGDGTASPSKIRNKVHMCGECYTKFVNYIKYKSLKEKADEQTKQSMSKGDNPVGYHDEHSRILRCSTCNGCDSICNPYCVDSCATTCPKKATGRGCAGNEKCDPECSGCTGCGGEACIDYGKETCSACIKKGGTI